MKTSIIGYPRIGKLRELKFASEKYFRNEIAQSELFDTAKKLRMLFPTDTKTSVYLHLTNILRLQEVIREKREMLKLLQ